MRKFPSRALSGAAVHGHRIFYYPTLLKNQSFERKGCFVGLKGVVWACVTSFHGELEAFRVETFKSLSSL